MEFRKLIDAIENAGFETQAYSGRGMYGRACLAVETNDEAGKLIVDLTIGILENADDKDEALEVLHVLDRPRTDSMGRGSVVYWPSVAWEETEEEES